MVFGCHEAIKVKKEFQNVQNYQAFEEVEDKGQKTIMSRWVII